MIVEVEFWQLVTLLVSFFGACAGALVVLLKQTQRHLDERFEVQEKIRAEQAHLLSCRLDAMEKSGREDVKEWQRVERMFNEWRVQLPEQYVRREDHIRSHSTIEAKLDGLALKIENVQLRGIITTGT